MASSLSSPLGKERGVKSRWGHQGEAHHLPVDDTCLHTHKKEALSVYALCLICLPVSSSSLLTLYHTTLPLLKHTPACPT